MEQLNTLLLTGGDNTKKRPFKKGSKVIGNEEEYEILGYLNNLMVLKPLNNKALLAEKNTLDELKRFALKSGFRVKDKPVLIHYRYADRFKCF
jgi:hypothetical protein